MWPGSSIDEYVYRYVGNCNIYYSSFILGSNFACVLCYAYYPMLVVLQCGIVLGTVLLLCSTYLTTVTCALLMKAGVVSKRRSYEFLGM